MMTTTTYSAVSNSLPEVFITKDKNRIKKTLTNGNTNVYLKDQDRFEIELYNPTHNNVLAKIKINGNYISNSGIIIKPAQRVFLDRFINTNNKFKFETYVVDGNDITVSDIIQNNGLVSVEFYTEAVSTYAIYYPQHWVDYTNTNTNLFNTTINDGSNFIDSSGAITCKSTTNIYNKETGRVERGEKSGTSLIPASGNFNYFCFHSQTIKILPISEQPFEITQIKRYCTTCGYKIRKDTWNFCPKCGEKFD